MIYHLTQKCHWIYYLHDSTSCQQWVGLTSLQRALSPLAYGCYIAVKLLTFKI